MAKAFEQRDMSGALFAERSPRPNGPTLTGSITVGGVRYRLAGWWKEPKGGGSRWLSLAVSAIEERAPAGEEGSDDAPF